MTINIIEAAHRFHQHAESPFPDVAGLPPNERRGLVLSLVTEEYTDLTLASVHGEMAEYVDGLLDIMWVCAQGLLETGMTPLQVSLLAAEVERANMSKVTGPLLDANDGKPYRSEAGKILKPPGFKPPDIKGVLREISRAD